MRTVEEERSLKKLFISFSVSILFWISTIGIAQAYRSVEQFLQTLPNGTNFLLLNELDKSISEVTLVMELGGRIVNIDNFVAIAQLLREEQSIEALAQTVEAKNYLQNFDRINFTDHETQLPDVTALSSEVKSRLQIVRSTLPTEKLFWFDLLDHVQHKLLLVFLILLSRSFIMAIQLNIEDRRY